jgi:SAM-dependent methyltransferase
MMAKSKLKAVEVPTLLKLDLGCGPNKKDGFLGVDARPFDGKVDLITDLSRKTWFFQKGSIPCLMWGKRSDIPDSGKEWYLPDGSVSEVHCSHFIEHLDAKARINFVNELHRVLIDGGKATIVTPHWASNRAYGDLTHQWPPVSEMWFYYLDKNWRATNAPHNDFYTCDFACTWGYSLHPAIQPRNQEYQMHAMTFFREAAQDMICTMVKRA